MIKNDPRRYALLMAQEIDPQDEVDGEYIHEWVPEHRHDPNYGGPDCAACWMADFDRALAADRKAQRAEAWQEGFDDRRDWLAYRKDPRVSAPLPVNPYREDSDVE